MATRKRLICKSIDLEDPHADPTIEELERERDELLRVWPATARFLEKPGVDFHRIAQQDGNAKGMPFRKVHDRFGWKAKDHCNCGGAPYRSSIFIRLSPAVRCGSSGGCSTHATGQNVHIEHTVQASALAHNWNASRRSATDESVLKWILAHSVATAMHPVESEGLPPNNKNIPALPFERYLGRGLKIWNVLDGELISLETFTFAAHRAIMTRLTGLDL